MRSSRPQVTVGMAVYNGEAYLEAALASIFAQDFRDWELVIINDGSTDSSRAIIEQFHDPRVRVFHNKTNKGLVTVRNQILAAAQGDFIAWLDQDDLASPNRLSTQVSFLRSNRHVSICGSLTKMLVHTEDGPDRAATPPLPLTHRDIRATLPFGNPLACNTVMMRLADIRQLGLEFRPEFGNSLDYDMWSRASDRLFAVNLPFVLGTYRIHRQQTSQGIALQSMNDHALNVQVQILRRVLGIPMTGAQIKAHRAATIAPLDIPNIERLEAIAEWFSLLREANRIQRGFDQHTFNQALTRQWFSVLSAAAHRQGRTRVVRYWVGSPTISLFGIHSTIRGAIQVLQRKQRRRFRNLPTESHRLPSVPPSG